MKTGTIDVKKSTIDLINYYDESLKKQLYIDFENMKSLLEEQNECHRASIKHLNALYNFLMQDRSNRRNSEQIAKSFNLLIDGFNDSISTNNLAIDTLNNFKNGIKNREECLHELSKIED